MISVWKYHTEVRPLDDRTVIVTYIVFRVFLFKDSMYKVSVVHVYGSLVSDFPITCKYRSYIFFLILRFTSQTKIRTLKWSRYPDEKRRVVCSIPGGEIFSFWIVSLVSLPYSSGLFIGVRFGITTILTRFRKLCHLHRIPEYMRVLKNGV